MPTVETMLAFANSEIERLQALIDRDCIQPCACCGKKLSWQYAGDATNAIEVETGKQHTDCVPMDAAPPGTFRYVERQANDLAAAIRKHRDQRGDNRCWLDDLELYRVLGEPIDEAEFALHCPEEMIKNCTQYIASRQPDGVPYVSPQRRIEVLETALADAIKDISGSTKDRIAHYEQVLKNEVP